MSGVQHAYHRYVLTFVGCRVGQYKEGEAIESAQEFASRVFMTCYMGTVNSGGDTKRRAAALAEQVRLWKPEQCFLWHEGQATPI